MTTITKRLAEALRETLRYLPSGIVFCHGDKCRESWCESCFGEDYAEEAMEKVRATQESATVALIAYGAQCAEVADDTRRLNALLLFSAGLYSNSHVAWNTMRSGLGEFVPGLLKSNNSNYEYLQMFRQAIDKAMLAAAPSPPQEDRT